jgi:outer membrane protein OmpA-like peptidoglycan-associated protein
MKKKIELIIASMKNSPRLPRLIKRLKKFNEMKFSNKPLEYDAASELDKLVQILKDNPFIKVELGSHTDSRGKANYNQKLSENRAESSANYIKKRIQNPDRITYKGYGETKLVNDCKNRVSCTEAQHQLNRRTEFVIQK